MRLLAFGNSFTDDAIGQNFHELLDEAGVPACIYFFKRGSCSLAMHLEFARTDSAAYTLVKIGPDGAKTQIGNCRCSDGIYCEHWTHVCVQQVSEYSGKYASYQESLPELIEWIRDSVSADAKMIFHQTWAYAQDYERGVYAWYDNDQMTMYDSIMSASRRVMKDFDIDFLVPSGTAIQNARSSYVGDSLNRDGMHLSYDLGRYVAACAWLEALTGSDSRTFEYAPADLDPQAKKMAQEAAHAAVINPFEITDLSGYDFK